MCALVHVFSGVSDPKSVGLGCTGLLNVANPVTLTMDGNGVVTAATINTQLLQQILAGVRRSTAFICVDRLTYTCS